MIVKTTYSNMSDIDMELLAGAESINIVCGTEISNVDVVELCIKIDSEEIYDTCYYICHNADYGIAEIDILAVDSNKEEFNKAYKDHISSLKHITNHALMNIEDCHLNDKWLAKKKRLVEVDKEVKELEEIRSTASEKLRDLKKEVLMSQFK